MWSFFRGDTVILNPAGKSQGQVGELRGRVEQAWRLRWGSLLACTAARGVAASLLELPFAQSADGDTPASHEVEHDHRHALLS